MLVDAVRPRESVTVALMVNVPYDDSVPLVDVAVNDVDEPVVVYVEPFIVITILDIVELYEPDATATALNFDSFWT